MSSRNSTNLTTTPGNTTSTRTRPKKRTSKGADSTKSTVTARDSGRDKSQARDAKAPVPNLDDQVRERGFTDSVNPFGGCALGAAALTLSGYGLTGVAVVPDIQEIVAGARLDEADKIDEVSRSLPDYTPFQETEHWRRVEWITAQVEALRAIQVRGYIGRKILRDLWLVTPGTAQDGVDGWSGPSDAVAALNALSSRHGRWMTDGDVDRFRIDFWRLQGVFDPRGIYGEAWRSRALAGFGYLAGVHICPTRDVVDARLRRPIVTKVELLGEELVVEFNAVEFHFDEVGDMY